MSELTALNPAEEAPVVRLIDDDVSFRRAVQRLLRAAGHVDVQHQAAGCTADAFEQHLAH